jgi:hypothetical protein
VDFRATGGGVYSSTRGSASRARIVVARSSVDSPSPNDGSDGDVSSIGCSRESGVGCGGGAGPRDDAAAFCFCWRATASSSAACASSSWPDADSARPSASRSGTSSGRLCRPLRHACTASSARSLATSASANRTVWAGSFSAA